jgi:hypothetical protein
MASTGKNYRGCRFTLGDEVFSIQDQSWTAHGLMVWFDNDGTKWLYLDEVADLLLDEPKDQS